MASPILEFFHDAVCGWRFNISSRMRTLAAGVDLHIRRRAFALPTSRAEIAARWGGPEDARETILGHWAVGRQVGDRPARLDIDAMRAAPFEHPHGMTAALACRAAERLGGQAALWAVFVRLQHAHPGEARTVADPATALRAGPALPAIL